MTATEEVRVVTHDVAPPLDLTGEARLANVIARYLLADHPVLDPDEYVDEDLWRGDR